MTKRQRLRRPPKLSSCPVPSSPRHLRGAAERPGCSPFTSPWRPGPARALTPGAERRDKEEEMGARSEKEPAVAAALPRHLGEGRRGARRGEGGEGTRCARLPASAAGARASGLRPVAVPPARPSPLPSPALPARARQDRAPAPAGGGGGAGPRRPLAGGSGRGGPLRPPPARRLRPPGTAASRDRGSDRSAGCQPSRAGRRRRQLPGGTRRSYSPVYSYGLNIQPQ